MDINNPERVPVPASLDKTDSDRGGAGKVTVSPDDLRRFAARAEEIVSGLDGLDVDRSLLTDEVVGHSGFAASLQDFFHEFGQRAADFRTHLSNISGSVQHAAARYQDTDDAAANPLID